MIARLTRPKAILDDIFSRLLVTGAEILDRASNAVPEADSVRSIVDDFEAWDTSVRTLLQGAFTEPAPGNIYPANFSADEFRSSETWGGDLANIRRGLGVRITTLRSINDMLGLYEEPSEAIRVGQEHPASRSSSTVFIVHGRSESPKYQLARFIEAATNATPIILHEQAKRGQVIIETLEEYAATAAFV